MDHQQKVARLKGMLAQVGGGGLEAVRPAADGGLESAQGMTVPGVPPADPALADRGLEKLRLGRDDQVSHEEAAAMEAIILPRERPVFFIDDGTYPALPFPWTAMNATENKARLNRAIAAIGRIELPTQPMIPYGGTGFLVGDGLLMTNRHVAQLFSRGVGVDGLLFTSSDAAIDFRRERHSSPDDLSSRFEIERVLMVHPYWDMALLRVKGLSGRAPLELAIDEPGVDQDVVAIGYPARDIRNDLLEQDRIFQRIYNVKRFHPGRMRARRQVPSFEQTVDAAVHDASTLGGCSGSAVLDPKTGRVVALHFAGEYLVANYGVPALELARDPRVVDAGVRFSGTLPATHEWDAAWRRVGAMESSVAPASAGRAATAASAAPFQGSVSWDLPLRVTVSMGGPVRIDAGTDLTSPVLQPAAAPAAPVVETLRIPVIYDGLEEREGYNPDFLGIPVPMPVLTERGRRAAATLEDGSHELKYDKFSVVMHKRRRLALFTAANIDWRASSRLIDGRKPSRKELTGLNEGDIEKWVTDWRIPEEHQLPDVFYSRDAGAFDKGHLVRRDDVAWGADLPAMQRSNGDTYHTTNCSPQRSAFNQSARGVDNWGDLENMVQQQTRSETAVVMSGPVLAPSDTLFDGRGDNGTRIVVPIPRRFWKIIVALDPNQQPQAFGFVLEQDLSGLPDRGEAVARRPEEFTVPPPWRPYMKPLAEIEKLLNGLAALGPVKDWDQFDDQNGEAVRSAMSTSGDA